MRDRALADGPAGAGEGPLIVSLPHTGTQIPADIEAGLVSPWLARKDADWWVERLYAFAEDLGATAVRTVVSRTVVDVNRDPSGAVALSRSGRPQSCARPPPSTASRFTRTAARLTPPRASPSAGSAGSNPITRPSPPRSRGCMRRHGAVVLYEAHSIRSRIPRLFDGELPQFNVGTNGGASCDPALGARRSRRACAASASAMWSTAASRADTPPAATACPADGVHAIQMELACRGYMKEPASALAPSNWPSPFDEARAAPLSAVLSAILNACLAFAS